MTTKYDPQKMAVLTDLQQAYLPNEAYHAVRDRFDHLLAQRRHDLAEGYPSLTRGIILCGQSGSGKSTTIREVINRTPDLILEDEASGICEVVSLQVPSPATLKLVGTVTLHALGYPLTRDKSAGLIWQLVKDQLKRRRSLFLHLDEAQDLTRYQTDNERAAVIRTLKSLMENSDWPVGLILSGMPELIALINQDEQLVRRFYPVRIERLHPTAHARPVLDLVGRYARRANLECDPHLLEPDFARRLLHAADYEFGLLAEFVVQAIRHVILSEPPSSTLDMAAFVAVYHQRSGAPDGLNPFATEEFAQIDVRRLLEVVA